MAARIIRRSPWRSSHKSPRGLQPHGVRWIRGCSPLVEGHRPDVGGPLLCPGDVTRPLNDECPPAAKREGILMSVIQQLQNERSTTANMDAMHTRVGCPALSKNLAPHPRTYPVRAGPILEPRGRGHKACRKAAHAKECHARSQEPFSRPLSDPVAYAATETH